MEKAKSKAKEGHIDLRMNKKYFYFFILLLSVALVGGKVKAEGQLGSTHTQELVIVKYGLNKNSYGFIPKQTVDTGEKINNIPIDNNTNQLKPMAGVQYEIQQIYPTQDGSNINLSNLSTYQKIGSTKTIVTGQDGMAQINLSDGFYIVSELANTALQLKKPAPPVLLRLPAVNPTKNGYLDIVYLYPKSSIDQINQHNLPQKSTQTMLPKTGTDSSDDFIVVGGLLFIFASRMFLGKRKERSGL